MLAHVTWGYKPVCPPQGVMAVHLEVVQDQYTSLSREALVATAATLKTYIAD